MRPMDQISANPFYQGTFPSYTTGSMQQSVDNIPYTQNSNMPSLYNGISPSYSHGGQPGLRDVAQHLSQMGQGEDSVLAHIHPLEAMELQRKYGSSGINPITGLPQYGFKLGRFFKKLLPIVGGLVGTMFGGPAGGAIGGAIGGAAKGESGRHGLFQGHLSKPLLQGAGIGLATGIGGQMLGLGGSGGAAGLGKSVGQGGGIFGNLFGGGAGGLGNMLSGGVPGVGGGLLGGGEGGGLLSGLGGSNLLQTGLLGAAALGIMKGKMKPAQTAPVQYSAPEQLPPPPQATAATTWRPDQEATPFTPRQRVLKGYHPDVYKAGELPEFDYYAAQSPLRPYAYGGRYYEGEEGGQEDNINARVSPGEYVWDADAVSLLGDGNNAAGARKIRMAIEKLRAQKRGASSKTIPPKAKSLEYYMSMRGR